MAVISKPSVPQAKAHLAGDPELCTGCRLCELVCSLHNEGVANADLAKIRIDRLKDYGLWDTGLFVPEVCYQCDEPACLMDCPQGAIKADESTGFVRTVDKSLCTGSCISICQGACTWRMPSFNPGQSVANIKCHLCQGDPTCVKFCPTGALKLLYQMPYEVEPKIPSPTAAPAAAPTAAPAAAPTAAPVAAAPASIGDFVVTGITCNPTRVTAGDPVNVIVTVKNGGASQGTQTLVLHVDGAEADTKEVTLAAGASDEITFKYKTKTTASPESLGQVVQGQAVAGAPVERDVPVEVGGVTTTFLLVPTPFMPIT